MPEPLPVDVVQTWWDYFVQVVGVVSGLATAGALIVAALVFKRQLDDARRAQASLVICSYVSEEMRGFTRWTLSVKNYSKMPVFDMLISRKISTGLRHHGPVYKLDPDEEYNTGEKFDERGRPRAFIEFTDASGLQWERDSHGGLRPRPWWWRWVIKNR